MENAKVESKKVRKAAKSRRVAGVQVRSGVKAGGIHGGGIHGGEGGRLG
jgi:hypothetical protein